MFSNILKIEQKRFDEQVESIIRRQGDYTFESYKAELYDIKGNKIKYDSITRKITIE